jgi:hypothetical protein
MDDYLTLEDLFYNVEHLTGYQALQWIRFKRPGETIPPTDIETVVALHKMWKLGQVRVEGDNVTLREWEGN